jgi:CDP-diacylglycerol--inositol 3-phosphatidyltransferase
MSLSCFDNAFSLLIALLLQVQLFIICAGNELFFVALYLMKWDTTAFLTWPQLLALFCFPICALKNVINIVQLWKASKMLVGVDLAERAAARERRSH